MPRSKKPRKQFRGAQRLDNPIAFGMSRKTLEGFELRERIALDRVLAHDASSAQADIGTLEATAEAAIRTLDYAVEHPEAHDVPVDQLRAARAVLTNGGRAVLRVQARWKESGKLGATGEERADLLALVDASCELRNALPRRLQLTGHQLCLNATTGLHIPRERSPL